MALKKIITNTNGVSCSYHKIGEINISDAHEGEVVLTVMVYSYVDKTIRDKSETLVVSYKEYRFTVALTEIETNNIFTIAYEKLKTTPTFEGAEDC